MKLIFTKEEKFIRDILFDLPIDILNIKKLDLDNLIVLSSSELLIPTLHVKLKKKKLLRFFPNDFCQYIEWIYNENKANNLILIEEINSIEKKFVKKIKSFQFLKGAYYLKNKIYDDIGERMIGDIDLLISEKEKNKTIRLLNKNNYYNVIDYKYRSNRHLPRFRNSRKNFAIEIHTKLFDKEKYNINISKFLENPQSQIINYAILNYQINDYATLKSMFSYRTMHDYFCLSRYFENSQKKSQNNHIKIFLNFISILENNGIKKIKLNLQNRIIISRYFLKRKYFIFFKIDEIICEILIRVPVFFDQMIEFLINKNYRSFFLKRLFKIINKVIEVRK